MVFYKISGTLYNLDTIQSIDYFEEKQELQLFFVDGMVTEATLPQFTKEKWIKLQSDLMKIGKNN